MAASLSLSQVYLRSFEARPNVTLAFTGGCLQALGDAVAAVAGAGLPVIEVHLSNLAGREEFRHQSFIGKHCAGSISGFGLESYRLALHYLARQQRRPMGFGRR